MSDPYTSPGGTLRNLLGLTVQSELDAQESRIATARQADFDVTRQDGPFDFGFLCMIHAVLFQDTYDWAGRPRTVSLAKQDFEGPGGQIIGFTPPRLIQTQADRLFRTLPDIDDLASATPSEFATVVGDFLVELNNLHPFREGNGRTQRMFVRHLGRRCGFDVAWDVVTKERMIAVSVKGALGDPSPMRRLIAEISDPNRARALRKVLNHLKSNGFPWSDLYIATTVSGQTYQGILAGKAPPDFMLRVRARPEGWIAVGHVDDLPDGAGTGNDIAFTGRRW